MNVDLRTSLTIPQAAQQSALGDSPKAAAETNAAPGLTISTGDFPALDDMEGVDSIPEEALNRNDRLGQLLKEVFAFDAPKMPTIGENVV